MKHSKVRHRIIETASYLFYKNGYNSTGINEVIAEAGIAKATLYSHFKSKEDLCIAYLKHKNDTFMHDIEAFARAEKQGNNQILAIFDFLDQFFQDKDFNGCWCLKTVSEIPKDNERVRDEIQNQKQGFIQLIENLVNKNIPGLKAKELHTLTRKIYLLYEGALGESHLHRENWPIHEAKDLCKQILN